MRYVAAAMVAWLASCEHAQPAVTSSTEPPCIADSLPPLHLHWVDRVKECSAADQPCRRQCDAGDGDACVSRALAIEQSPGSYMEARALFERACKLGSATGCTNWAATVWSLEDDPPTRCLLRTFEKACAVDEEFGCGMAGRFRVDYKLGFAPVFQARLELEATCARLRGFPCRILALKGERGPFAPMPRSRIAQLMKQACDGNDQAACGEHATVEETFSP